MPRGVVAYSLSGNFFTRPPISYERDATLPGFRLTIIDSRRALIPYDHAIVPLVHKRFFVYKQCSVDPYTRYLSSGSEFCRVGTVSWPTRFSVYSTSGRTERQLSTVFEKLPIKLAAMSAFPFWIRPICTYNV